MRYKYGFILYSLILIFLLSGCSGTGNNISHKTTASAPNFNITLAAIDNSKLPFLNAPQVAEYESYWLIIGGNESGIHGFERTFANQKIYVFNPITNSIYFESIGNTDLPKPVQEQITSVAPISLVSESTLYVIGGYYNYNPSESNGYTTIQTITSYNIPGMVAAIINNDTHLSRFVNYNTSNQIFKVTGGGLGKIGNNFYLAFGQDCEGFYCQISQTYKNSVYEFSLDSSLNATTINYVYSPESTNSGFRRRDYNLVPFRLGNQPTLLAMAGPFTPSMPPVVWTNAISIESNLNYNNSFLNQQANQYQDAAITMYSKSNNMSYVATFSGFSTLYWSTTGLSYSNSTPYGNILDIISYNAHSNEVNEYANTQPLCSGESVSSCLYMGDGAVFIPIPNYFDNRNILQLDRITRKTLIGYLFGGSVSRNQAVLFTGSSTVTNNAYAVYITPNLRESSWINITNRESGTPFSIEGVE